LTGPMGFPNRSVAVWRKSEFNKYLGVVQVRVTPKTENPFTIKALSISGVTWKWQVLNHALMVC
jgi:hypothetical protein